MNEEEKLVTEEMNAENEDNPLAGKFCWAGLFMPQFWGIGNGLTIGLLAFIPIIFPFMALYFGFKGYELAYETVKYSVKKETFCKKQKKWKIVSFIYMIVFVSIIFLFNSNEISNYIHNKKELNSIIKQTKKQKNRLEEEIEKLIDTENLKLFVDGLECIPDGEVQFNEDGTLWRLKNSYGYDELSKDNVHFDQPRVYNVSQKFLVEDGRILTISFSVDENFQIQEGKYSIYSGGEIHMISPGLYSDLDVIAPYMDKTTIDLILNAD